MPRRPRDEEEEPEVEPGEEDVDQDDEEGPVGPEDPTLKLPGELDPPHQTTYSAKHLFEMLKDGDIDVNPEYQREVVWAEKAQADVIESYIKNYHVPPLLLKKTDDGKFVCMDGKQRLTSIKKFFSGQLAIRSPEGKNLWYKIHETSKNKGGNLLPAPYRKKMERVQISVNEYHSLTINEEREMFQRVQYGLALNVAEKLYALPGVWPDYVRELYRDIPDRFWEQIHLGKKRMARFYAMSIPRPGIPRDLHLRRWMESAETLEGNEVASKPGQTIVRPTQAFRDFVSKTMNTMRRIANTTAYREIAFVNVNELPRMKAKQKPTTRGKKKKGRNALSPVEFVCISIFISRNLDMHLQTMSRNIVAFRDLVQDRFPGEKKWNARVMDVFWDWIEKRVLEESDDEQDEEEEDEEEEEEEESDAQEDDYEEESPVPKTPPQTNGKVSAKASQRSSKVGPPPKSAKKAPTTPRTSTRSPRKRARVTDSSDEE